ncbi:hypothetical protein [Enterococcus faecium]|nr:hypothetical protein [Enterococcus faecium]MCM6879890.1 hypothetical protein [Enterococcus faecium]
MTPFEVFNEHVNQFPIVIDLPHSGTAMITKMSNELRSDAILANTD